MRSSERVIISVATGFMCDQSLTEQKDFRLVIKKPPKKSELNYF